MTRRSIYSGSTFETLAGYARAVVDGDWVFVSGTAGFDPKTMAFADTAAGQARQSLKTIAAALAEAGASLRDIVQVRVYLSDRAHVTEVSKILGETFSDPRPTNTTIICSFAVDEIMVEIEVVALRRKD
ncbi:MAG: RidA family protein [Alphaproteobacteria bacterium]|nr:RidA family protein [Alphaproteobacteria bacterium]